MTGVGTQTRRELSELMARLQRASGPSPSRLRQPKADGLLLSIDQLFAHCHAQGEQGHRSRPHGLS